MGNKITSIQKILITLEDKFLKQKVTLYCVMAYVKHMIIQAQKTDSMKELETPTCYKVFKLSLNQYHVISRKMQIV